MKTKTRMIEVPSNTRLFRSRDQRYVTTTKAMRVEATPSKTRGMTSGYSLTLNGEHYYVHAAHVRWIPREDEY
jgi:hypothetical protein